MTTSGNGSAPRLLELDGVSKYFGNVVALTDVSASVSAGEVTCILGDNGAGKSTLIKILSGVHEQDAGRVLVDGEEVRFDSPRAARAGGIATVYQDLAMVPLMSIWRNFFLGAEPTNVRTGRYAGIRLFADEEADAVALMQALEHRLREHRVTDPRGCDDQDLEHNGTRGRALFTQGATVGRGVGRSFSAPSSGAPSRGAINPRPTGAISRPQSAGLTRQRLPVP